MTKKQVKRYLKEATWLRFLSPDFSQPIEIAHTLLEKAINEVGINLGDAPAFLAALGMKVLPKIKSEMFMNGFDLCTQEYTPTVPYQFSFPVFVVFDGKVLWITDRDLIS